MTRILTLTLLTFFVAAPAFAQGRGPSTVRVERVVEQQVQQRRMITGDLRAQKRSRLASEEKGLVAELPVEEGQLVRKGDLIARLDDRRLQIELQQSQADLRVAEADAAEQKATLDRDQRELDELEALNKRTATNPKELRDARSAVSIAAAKVDRAKQELAVVQSRIDLLQTRIEDMRIVAPYDGVVIATHAELGEWITEGGVVAELLATDAVEVWLDVPQRFLGAVQKEDSAVALQIESNGRIIESRERRIVPEVDPKARTFKLIVPLRNTEGDLAPGVSVLAYVPTGAMKQQLTVPKDAVQRNAAGAFLYVVRESGGEEPPKALAVTIDIEYPIGERFVIRSNQLRDGDMVVVEGNERLFPGSPVNPIENAPSGQVVERTAQENSAQATDEVNQ